MQSVKKRIAGVISKFPGVEQNARLFMHNLRAIKYSDKITVGTEEQNAILRSVMNNGYYIFDEYYDQEWCEKCEAQIKDVVNEDYDFVHKGEDRRLFGVQNMSDELNQFYEDTFLQKLADMYYQQDSKPFVTLANWIWHDKNIALGSGGDWHRDSEFRQIKAIVYLTDVSADNGAFQIIERSNCDNKRQFNSDTRIMENVGLSNRLTGEQVDRLVAINPERLKTCVAKKGTVILADTSSLHRGSPVKNGERVAVFNYYYPQHLKNEQWAAQKFAPLVPEDFRKR